MRPTHVFADPQGVIYAVTFDGDILWYKDACRDGRVGWAWGSGNRIGSGWLGMRHVFAGGNGIIYAVTPTGELRWYRHRGYLHGGGMETWEPQDSAHNVVGHGWQDTRHLLWGGRGIIYAVAGDGSLRWYKHNGYESGGDLSSWEPQDTGYRTVGTGWGAMQHLFAMGSF